MVHLLRNVSLQDYHTFGTNARASGLAEFDSVETLLELLNLAEFQAGPRLLLGGGSNVLFTRDYNGLVLLNRITGIEVVEESPDQVMVRAGAGVVWHHLVQFAVERGWGGMENLSLIPGLTGAAPMQNIGAYGVELQHVFHELEAVEIASGRITRFNREECQFGYRESVFKWAAFGKYIITSVTVTLEKEPELNLEYGAIRETLALHGILQPTIRDVSEAVIAIRRSKLPDPAELGNAGSFFKNPELSPEAFAILSSAHPQVPHFPQHDDQVKVPAGWLIEQCGWKGKRVGRTGAHARQALVLVNYGGASGEEIWNHAQVIRESVQEKFGVLLQSEVNIIG